MASMNFQSNQGSWKELDKPGIWTLFHGGHVYPQEIAGPNNKGGRLTSHKTQDVQHKKCGKEMMVNSPLIQGHQWLIVPDHKAGYFLGVLLGICWENP